MSRVEPPSDAPTPDPGVPAPASVSAPAPTTVAAAAPVPDVGGAGSAALPAAPADPAGEPAPDPPVPPTDRAEIVRRVRRISDPDENGTDGATIRFGVELRESAEGGAADIFGYVPEEVPDGAILEIEFYSDSDGKAGPSVYVHVCEVRRSAFAATIPSDAAFDLMTAVRVTVRFGEEQPPGVAARLTPALKRWRGKARVRMEEPARFCRAVNRTAERLLTPLEEARAVWSGLCGLAARIEGNRLGKAEWDAWKAEHPPEVLRETLSGAMAAPEPHRYFPRFVVGLQALIQSLDFLCVSVAFHLKDKVEPPFDESATGAGITLREGTVGMPDRLVKTLLNDVERWYRRASAQVLDDVRREAAGSGRVPSGAESTVDELEGLYFEMTGKAGLPAGGGRPADMRGIFEELRRGIRALRDGGDGDEVLRKLKNRLTQ